MYVNVRINTQTSRGKKLIEELKRYPKTVEFENPATTGVVPEGYITSETFRAEVKRKLTESCIR